MRLLEIAFLFTAYGLVFFMGFWLRDLVDDRRDRRGWGWWVMVAIFLLIGVAGADRILDCVHSGAFPRCN